MDYNKQIKYLYLVLALAGTIIPLYYFYLFIAKNGFDITLCLQQMFDTPISSLLSWDLIISTLVLITFIITEGRRQKMKYTWIYIILNLGVGVSLALPAFLYFRLVKIEQRNQKMSRGRNRIEN